MDIPCFVLSFRSVNGLMEPAFTLVRDHSSYVEIMCILKLSLLFYLTGNNLSIEVQFLYFYSLFFFFFFF